MIVGHVHVAMLSWDDPFVLGFAVVLGIIVLMFVGQMTHRAYTQRGFRRDDRARRRMRKLRAVPIARRRSDPAESSEE